MTPQSWLLLSLFLFSTGLYGFLVRRTAVGILISIELMLNAAALNFVVFNRLLFPKQVDGQIMVVFILALTAAEVLVGIALLMMLFKQRYSVEVGKLDHLRH